MFIVLDVEFISFASSFGIRHLFSYIFMGEDQCGFNGGNYQAFIADCFRYKLCKYVERRATEMITVVKG